MIHPIQAMRNVYREKRQTYQVTCPQNSVLNFQHPPTMKNRRMRDIFVQKNDFWTRFKHETILMCTSDWCACRCEKQYLHTLRHTSWKKKGQKSAHFGSNLGGVQLFFHMHMQKNFNFKKFSETCFLVIL